MEQDRLLKIPVIMLTGATWNALEAGARSLGASGYLVKGKIDAPDSTAQSEAPSRLR